MALVKFGAGILGMTGSIGGNTFARNRSGNYVRARTKPVNPRSSLQNKVRSIIASLADRWSQVLDDAQRHTWNDYADGLNMKNRVGEDIHLSGYNHYIRSNSLLLRIGGTLVDAGPGIFELPAQDSSYSVTAKADTQHITNNYDALMAWAKEDGGFMFFFQGKPQNPQRNFFDGPWRFITAIAGIDSSPPASPKIGSAPFAIAALQRQWCYARILRADGRLSEPFRADCFVTANGA